MLLRKIWNPKAFKGHVSPHEFVQEVSNASQKKFHFGERKDASEFLSWFLNELHTGLGGKKTPGSSKFFFIFS
jgi:U4/U6.U5 tri-snRNP-associated protein 2